MGGGIGGAFKNTKGARFHAKMQGKESKVKFGSDAKTVDKLNRQMSKRGWTNDTVIDTVDNPFTTRKATNRATGNSATVY